MFKDLLYPQPATFGVNVLQFGQGGSDGSLC